MRLNMLSKAIILASTASIAMPGMAAENDDFVIEEIIVTAQKRAESLQDVALTVNAFGGEMLKDAGVFDFTDIEKLSAGVTLDGDSGHAANISIRGVGSQAASGLDPAVAVFIDGVVQNNIGSAFSSLLDIERIEVLRGPQGTLYGKNSPAGAMNIITRRPDSTALGGDIETTISSWGSQEVKGTVNLPLIENVLAARISGLYSESDGYVDNEYLDTPANDRQRSAGRIKLLYTPTEDLSATLIANYSESAVGNPLQLLGESIYDYEVFENDQGLAEDTNESLSLEVNWDMESHTLTSITGYQEYALTGPRDNDFTPAAVGAGGSVLTIDQSIRSFSQELRLTSTGDGDLEYMVGFFYSNQDQSGASLFDNGSFTQVLSGVDTTESFGLFSNNTYHFDDQWSLSFGLRYSDDRKSSESSQVDNIVGLINGKDKDHFTNMSGSLKLRYMPDSDTTYYASLDRAYRAGGFNVVAPQNYKDAGFSGYDKEVSHSIEFGAKATLWDGRLQINAALFYQDFESYQINSFLNDQAVAFSPFFVITAPAGNIRFNADGATAQGAEIEFAARITEKFTVSGAVAYSHVEMDAFNGIPTSFADAGYTTSGPVITDPRIVPGLGGDLSIVPTKNQGEEVLDGNAPLSASLVMEYADTLTGQSLDWFVRGITKYNGERDQDVMGAYTTVDLFAGLRSSDGSWSVTAWAKNLMDEEYLVFGRDAELSGQGVATGFPGVPRSYGITAGYSF
jgi:iron complex outermembrane recepter protein